MGKQRECSFMCCLFLGLLWIGMETGRSIVAADGGDLKPVAAETDKDVQPSLNGGFLFGGGKGFFFGGHGGKWGCHPHCEDGHICDIWKKECVPTNVCMDTCPTNEVCCGHGEDCVCPWPNRIYTDGSCNPCWCSDPEVCMSPHGDCVCPDDMVRDNQDNCVHCDPEKQCPKEGCPIDRICTIRGDGSGSTCECLPGSVENKDGECTWCFPCPEECDEGKTCITPGHGDPYCGCPPGTKEDHVGNCVNCPVCPDCPPGKDCVVKGHEATCECPEGTWEHGFGCEPIHACHDCDEDEICVLPWGGGPPHCDCPSGTVRKNGKCVDCHPWKDGHPGGSCVHGHCHGKHTVCGSSGHCECATDCYLQPFPTCIPKRNRKGRW